MPPSERRKKITIQASQICPLCREKVHREEVLTVCPGCQAVYHRECSGELASGRCTTLGCRYSRRRTSSGRRPTAPVRPERTPPAPRSPLTSSERTLRTVVGVGVTLAFFFLAVHFSKSIESDSRERVSAQRARRIRSVLATYRRRAVALEAIAANPAPPARWKFPPGTYHVADGTLEKPNAVLLTWRQLKDPSTPSPLPAYFPDSFRRGLCLSAEGIEPRSLNREIEEASRARYLIAVRIESLRPASAQGSKWRGDLEQANAEVVLRAYLYDFKTDPPYKGCLEVKTPMGFQTRELGSAPSLTPRQQLYVDELRASGLEPGYLPQADAAALHAAYQSLSRELSRRP